MKKQLFSLVLALVAGVTLSFGQNALSVVPTAPAPRALDVTCLSSDALHPVAGTPYTYAVTVPTPAGTKSFKWIVTQEKTFLANGILNEANAEAAGGTHIAAAGTELNAVSADPVGLDITITWKSFIHDAALPVFVVIYVENADAAGCTTQNVKVYQIEPKNAFTLDITNIALDGTKSAYGDNLTTCVSNIASATYDAAAPTGVVYDFGVDYIYYAVTAANFTTSWQPTFQITGLAGGTQTSLIEWAYPANANVATGWNATTAPVLAQDPTGTVGAAGECVIVRVTVDHNSEEVLTALNIQLAIDGLTNLAAAAASQLPDLHYVDCSIDNFTNDITTHVLNPRADIQSATPGAGVNFLPKK